MAATSASSRATTERLWEVVSDLAAWPDHLDTFTSVRHVTGPSPTGVGSRFEVRQPGLVTSTYEITEWAPGSAFTWVARAPGVVTTATHTISAVGDGSRLDLGLTWTGPLGRVATPLLGRRAQSMIDLEARTFARIAEG